MNTDSGLESHISYVKTISFYSDHQLLNALYFVPPLVIWDLLLVPINQQYYFWVTLGLMGLLYLYIRRRMCLACYRTISLSSKNFSNAPTFAQMTSESLLDGIDYEMLDIVDETRSERSDYVRLLHELSESADLREVFARLGKLKSLGYIRTLPTRATLTVYGIEYLNSPRREQTSKVPPKYGRLIAIARMSFEERNFANVTDQIHILCEELLHDKISGALGDKLESTWRQLQNGGKIRPDYSRASLGVLLRVAVELNLIGRDSLSYKLLDSFVSLRNPQKHSIIESLDENEKFTTVVDSSSAESALQLGEILLRTWF